MERVGPFVVVFVQLKVGQRLVPAPGVVAGDLRPLVVITRLAAHVNHAVDARAAAQHLAARVAQAAAIQAGGGLGFVQPIGARIANAIQVAHRNMHPVVIVFLARFNQQHALAGIGTQAVGQQAACGATANDDVVKGVFVHGRQCLRSENVKTYLAVGITNSAPLPMLSGQRCMMDFCLV